MDKNEALTRRGLAFLRSKAALVHNARETIRHAKAKRLIAVIKANAYGHGDAWAARTLYEQLSVKDFAVATVDEGRRVRQAMPEKEVSVILLGVQPFELAVEMAATRLAPVAGSFDWLLAAKKSFEEAGSSDVLSVHLAVDTGMGRVGAKTKEELASMVDFVRHDPNFELAGVMTHFATADEDNQAYYDQQLADFMNMVAGLEIPEKYWHLANSGTALFHDQEAPTATIRVGSVLYGYNPAMAKRPSPIQLQPVGSLVGRIWSVHRLLKGESLSYGATYTASKDEWVGTVPIGYADGLKRSLAGMSVLVNGRRQHVLGRITMDQIVISLPEKLPVNTEVTFIGRNGQEENTIEDLARFAQTIPHELLTGISERVPRVDRD
ncbi:alanine racemase [Fructobacillus sp. M1-13]|uniref:Alanine racemase n=1 Tax=Fructobacillus papyriferae TaxID=2713171 RepID=A0ABS5QS52_9LACO|nr:alanine racemase [Fructobacillus papyriferae]MBS9335300.1 alanine racemase [Fructobacillus papyriferae]MCD2159031.1 alanine racemase [Fructobacillus papyriferae]